MILLAPLPPPHCFIFFFFSQKMKYWNFSDGHPPTPKMIFFLFLHLLFIYSFFSVPQASHLRERLPWLRMFENILMMKWRGEGRCLQMWTDEKRPRSLMAENYQMNWAAEKCLKRSAAVEKCPRRSAVAEKCLRSWMGWRGRRWWPSWMRLQVRHFSSHFFGDFFNLENRFRNCWFLLRNQCLLYFFLHIYVPFPELMRNKYRVFFSLVTPPKVLKYRQVDLG